MKQALLAMTVLGTSLLQPVHAQTGPRQPQAEQSPVAGENSSQDYRVGPQDLLGYSVLEAPELQGSLRVSAGGEVTLPLAGTVKVAGKTAQQAGAALEEALRKSFMNNPHVSLVVQEMESHPVSVVGAVKKPGVFKIREPKTLLEMLSLTEGLAEDAGDTIMVMRGAGFPPETPQRSGADSKPAENSFVSPEANVTAAADTVKVKLKELLNSASSQPNALLTTPRCIQPNAKPL